MAAQLEVREQQRLPLFRQVEIAADGIRYRVLRSALTLGVIVLAVAFLVNTLTEHTLAASCKRRAHELDGGRREFSSFASLVAAETSADELAARIAELPADSWQLQALATWLGVTGSDLEQLRAGVATRQRARTWFAGLNPGERRLLAGKQGGEEFLAGLAEPAARDRLVTNARRIPLRLPDGLLDFAAGQTGLASRWQAAAASYAAAGARVRQRLGQQSFGEWLATAGPDAAAVMQEAGLAVAPERLAALQQQARAREAEGQLLTVLGLPGLADPWNKEFKQVFEQRTALPGLAADPLRAAWLATFWQRQQPDGPRLEAAQIQATAAQLIETRALLDLEARLAARYGTASSLSPQMFWLLVLSLLVCVAGITNAMLVSVLERFREIATMKCLGALNGFIARLFLLEAAFLGLCGGLVGVVLGGGLGVGRMAAAYGDWIWRFWPWSGLGLTAGVGVVCGLGLAVGSALYPAYAAARLPPMEAMRVQ